MKAATSRERRLLPARFAYYAIMPRRCLARRKEMTINVAALICLFLGCLCLTAPARAADAPQVFWASDPVLPNDTVLAMGEGMGAVTAARLARLPDTTPTGAMTLTGAGDGLAWQVVKPLQVTPNAAKFVVPPAWKAGAFACRLVAGQGVSKTFLVNAPDPWWLQGDGGDAAAPGGWLRVFGKSLGFGGVSRALLRDASGRRTLLKAAPNDGFALRFALPPTLAPGAYTVFVHNGTGGDAAWGRAGALAVRRPDPWPAQVFNVMDFYGANAAQEIQKTLGKGSPAVDRTEAIQAALQKAEANGGGVVYFAEGAYAYRGELKVPPRTILRGAGMGLVTLWWGKGGFALDGGSSERRLDDANVTPPDLITGGTFGLEDLSLYLPREYATGITAGDGFEMQRVRIRVDRYWIRSGQREDGTTLNMGSDCRVTDCDILAKGIGFVFSGGHDDLIARNRVQAGKCPIGMQKADGLIVEDNDFVSLDPTAYVNLSNEGRNVYYARNRHESQYAQQSDFSWTFDGGGVAYQGTLAATDGTRLTLARDPTYPQWAPEGSPLWHRAVVCILAGRGTGQYRFVTANAGRAWQINRPFDVAPDGASVVSIVPFRGRVLLVGNHFEDAGWVNLGYGTSLDVVCAHNSLYRVGALLNLGLRDPDGVLPSWYVQYLDNDVYEGKTLVQTTGDERDANVFGGTSTRGAVHRRLHLHADNCGTLDVGGNANDVIMEHCRLDDARSAFTVGLDTAGVLLRGNVFFGPSHYSGGGLGNAVVLP